MKPTHAALIAAFLFVSPAYAETSEPIAPEPVEMSAKNPVSELVITIKDCPLDPSHGFANYAYIIEQEMIVAEGCWARHGAYVDIWIPAVKMHFQLKAIEFFPRDVEPEL
jgi:hypothetical protein